MTMKLGFCLDDLAFLLSVTANLVQKLSAQLVGDDKIQKLADVCEQGHTPKFLN